MELQEIEKKIALGELSAAEVFAEMKQHIQAEEVVYFFSADYFKDGVSRYYWTQYTTKNVNSTEVMDHLLKRLSRKGSENIKVLSFNRC